MTDLSPQARALVARAKEQGPQLLGPSAQDRARLREKLVPLWAAQAAHRQTGSRLRQQLSITAAVLAGLGLLGWLYTRSPAAETAPLAGPTARPTASPVAPDAEALAPLTAARTAQQSTPTAGRPLATGSATQPQAAAGVGSAVTHSGKRTGPRLAPVQRLAAQASVRPAERATHANHTEVSAPRDITRTRDADSHAQPASAQVGERRTPSPLEAAGDAHGGAVRAEATPRPPSIEGELELLGAAQSALQRQQPSRALTLLQEHAFRFPTGALGEERMAMQAMALCALQRKHAAQTILADLAARGSRSALLPRIRRQCGL